MPQVFLGLGANLGNPAANLCQALELMAQAGLKIRACSSFYQTAAVGFTQQPDFVNAVALVETELAPLELLDVLQGIEQQLGRKPTFRWGPRVIDLDILLYGNAVVRNKRLCIPHPHLAERKFVLQPLVEIAPEVRHPVSGKTAKEMLAELKHPSRCERLPVEGGKGRCRRTR